MECDDLPRGKDFSEITALELLEQNEDAIAIYEVCEGKFSDISREMAELWFKKLLVSFTPDHDEWPDFIQRHISPLMLEEAEDAILAQIEADYRHVQSYLGPL